ncbi:MAG: hypothetical protein KME64_25960 [Scytonematopsis contorta HA4267-MV1]|jgi:hypothetical protein|nr:hypothetical protein [Scytonematopsis contorta HA4267-MV1]
MKRWMVLALFSLSFLLTIFITKEDVVIAEAKVDAVSAYNHANLNTFPDASFKKLYNFPDLPSK